MATEQLKVKITADASQAKAEIGKFKSALKGATSSADDSSETMTKLKSSLDMVKGVAKGSTKELVGMKSTLGKVAIAAAAAAAAIKTVKAAINNAISVAASGDAIKDNAQKVFMGTTAYQEWGYVLKQNGIEINALKVGMRQFAQQVATGSDALQKYGITATDVDTAFGQAIANIQNMRTETEKIAAATELFGSRALELFPVLNLTNAETQSLMNTYRALGGTMSNELIAASDVCTDSITAMKAAWGGLRNLLAQYFLPIITKVVQWITLAIAKIRIVLAAIFGVKESFGGGNKKTSLPATTGSVATNTGNTANNLKKAAKHAKELKRTLMGIDELSKLAEKATAAAASTPSSGSSGGGGVGDVGVADEGLFDGIISEETLKKIDDFKKRVDEIKAGFSLIATGIKEALNGDWETGLGHIKEGIEKIFPSIADLKDKWADLKAKLGERIEAAKVYLEDKFSAAWATIKGVWETVKTTIGGKIQTAKAVLEDKMSSTWSTIKGIWDRAKEIRGTISATMKLKLKNSFSKAWNKVKKTWNNLANFGTRVATIKLTLQNLLKTAWNSVANKIQAARAAGGAAGTFARSVLPDMKPLAKGGVLSVPTPALVGEYPGARSNPEIVSPQNIMYETMMKANGDMASVNAQIGRQIIAAIEKIDMNVKIGDETIAKSAQRGNMAYYYRTGKHLVTT